MTPCLNRAGELAAWFVDPVIERSIESAVEHGEQTSHLGLAPQTMRGHPRRIFGVLNTRRRRWWRSHHRAPGTSYGKSLRLSVPNRFLLAYNEIPPGLKVRSLSAIQ